MDINNIKNVSRRDFLKISGVTTSVFALGINLPFAKLNAAELDEHELNFFVSIAKDGQVTIVNHRSEMGQGIKTSVPQIIADELEAAWSKVSVIQAKGDAKYGPQSTGGSASIRNYFTYIRQMGAVARDMLEQAAANVWKINKSQVKAKNHFVVNQLNGKKISYGDLAIHAAKLETPNKEKVKLKAIKDFSLIGKDVKLVDLDLMVAGKAQYAQDIQLPNMLIASIERPPVVGGSVKSFDASEAKKIKGVVDVIQLKDRTLPTNVLPLSGVAVVAKNTWAAIQGRKKLKIQWEGGSLSGSDSNNYQQKLKKIVNTKGIKVRNTGEIENHQYDKSKTVEATYSVPYIHHAPMETPAATAVVKGDSCTIWAGTQSPQWVQKLAAAELGLSKEEHHKVEVNVTLMGGAFGRKSKGDFAIEAVELSKATGKPVKVIWSREDDIKHGFYHSVSANYCKAELTKNGSADNWVLRNAHPPIGWLWNTETEFPSDRALSLGFADVPFAIKNLRVEKHKVKSYVRPGWVRSVACINNGFALGSFVDELAVKAKIKPRQMWLNLLGDNRIVDPNEETFKYSNYELDPKEHPIDTKRIKSLINLLEKKSGFENKTAENEGWGMSFLRSFGSYVAAATKVRVEDKKVTVLEMHTAVDCGIAVTPDRINAQMEGAMIFGLSIALMGEITTKDGVVEQGNFHDYPVIRINQSPEMHVYIVESDAPPGGIGEPGVPPVIPSITNAIYHASGVRVRDLPVNKVLSV